MGTLLSLALLPWLVRWPRIIESVVFTSLCNHVKRHDHAHAHQHNLWNVLKTCHQKLFTSFAMQKIEASPAIVLCFLLLARLGSSLNSASEISPAEELWCANSGARNLHELIHTSDVIATGRYWSAKRRCEARRRPRYTITTRTRETLSYWSPDKVV